MPPWTCIQPTPLSKVTTTNCALHQCEIHPPATSKAVSPLGVMNCNIVLLCSAPHSSWAAHRAQNLSLFNWSVDPAFAIRTERSCSTFTSCQDFPYINLPINTSPPTTSLHNVIQWPSSSSIMPALEQFSGWCQGQNCSPFLPKGGWHALTSWWSSHGVALTWISAKVRVKARTVDASKGAFPIDWSVWRTRLEDFQDLQGLGELQGRDQERNLGWMIVM